MILQGRRVPASEALDWGIADQVVAPDQLTGAATQMAESLASGPTAAFGRMKNLLTDSESTSLETQLELEARGIAACVDSADAQEGIAAFVRSEEHTSELQSLMRISYAVFCLKKKTTII